ncbi:MAG: 3-deoxy-D-manno-octulosonic acid transferase [Bacteroidales bacterium]|nr:3-deoxy-D-manno-octulosonic acid transferase [Bacteroidales bacterium]
MTRFIYGLVLIIYNIGIHIAALFNRKAALWVAGRKNIWKEIQDKIKPHDHLVWFHCASLGEFEQGLPVIEEYKKKVPKAHILITFFSPSGYEVKKDYPGADYVLYLPLDLLRNVKRFIKLVNPKLVVFVKYEYWFNYLHQLWKQRIPVFLISANFRENQWFFRWYGKPFRKIFSFFTHMFVQNRNSKEILSKYGFDNVTVSGDTRFDRVYQIVNERREIPLVKKFKQQKMLVIVGSSWKEDEAIIIKYINQDTRGLKWIIAPHEIDNQHIERIEEMLNKPSVRFSDSLDKDISIADVLIIDNIGLLSSLYAYGNIAWVGGGFGRGVHNILEPATFGIPVFFGPNYPRFQEAVDLVKLKGAFVIKTYEEFINRLEPLLDSTELLENTGKINANYVNTNIGAKTKIVNNLLMI